MRYYRRPKTRNEKRATFASEDYYVEVRAKRNNTNLPDSWDDINRSTWGHRSWKRHRKTRWKPERSMNNTG